MPEAHDFAADLRVGQEGERELDALFGRWNTIRPATRAEQRQGIDRWFTLRDGARISVEYKTDRLAAKTGNAFIETVSMDTAHKPGWAETSRADWLVYYVPGADVVYVVSMVRIRERLGLWRGRYPTRAVDNGDYRTRGLLVPLRELEALAEQVINLADCELEDQS